MAGPVDFWEDVEFDLFKVFCWVALAGALVAIVSFLASGPGPLIFGVFMMLPMLLHGTFLTIWHWKYRYKGTHDKLWGALLILENSGWSRLIYFLRHVMPDWRNSGRYLRPVVQKAEPSLEGRDLE